MRISHLIRRARPSRAAAALLALALCACNHDDGVVVFTPFNVPNSVAIADVNGDGAPDLLVATTLDQGLIDNPGFANVILNSAATPGTFSSGVAYPTTGADPASIAVADLTGAHALDMVVASATGSVSVYLHGTTAGTFQPAVNYDAGGAPNQVVIADVNGDGHPDIVLADSSVSGGVILLLQDAAHPGQFLAAMKLPTGVITNSVAVADVDGDGAPDLIATGYDAAGDGGAVYVFHQNAAQPGTFLTPVSFPAGPQPQSVKVADMNGDGRPDLVVADFGPGADGLGAPGVALLLQDPAHAGAFLAPVSYATPGGSVDVAIGDLDGDGLPDVVVANLGPFPTGSISVLRQDAAHPGSLLAAVNYAAFGQPLGVAIGDLNHDGHPDIAVADATSAIVLLNTGTGGQFAPAVQVGQ